MRVFESGVQRKICGPKTKERAGEWKRLRNEKLYDLYSSLNIVCGDKIEKNDVGGACSTYGIEDMYIRDFGWETEGRRPLGKTRPRWEDKIQMDFHEVPRGWTGLIWPSIGTSWWHL